MKYIRIIYNDMIKYDNNSYQVVTTFAMDSIVNI